MELTGPVERGLIGLNNNEWSLNNNEWSLQAYPDLKWEIPV